MACACLAEGTVDNVYKLYVGQIKILKVGNIKRVAVGNSKVLSTTLLNNGQLLLIAESAGDSNVHIWFNNGAEKDLAVRVSTQFTTLSQAAKEVQVTPMPGDAARPTSATSRARSPGSRCQPAGWG